MKRAAISLGVLFGLWLLSYFALSPFGAYAPADFGTNGIKYYWWAPVGFYDPATGRWRRVLTLLYWPLFITDGEYWHTHGHFPRRGDPVYPPRFPSVPPFP